MTVEGSLREQISNSIRLYLFQFESHSKAITEIQKMCDISPEDLEKLPREMRELKQKQQKISGQIIDESMVLKDQINQEKQNERKIEKVFQNINDLKVKLLEVDAKLKAINRTDESAKSCNEAGTEIKGALLAQFKLVLDKLLDARKNFPDIYKEVEAETGIHFFTPFA
jgi:predicted RNase H-like nuclease (RuvC/YqgF family)